MKVYIAGRYSRRDELKSYALILSSLGIVTTSRWLDETNPLQTEMGDDTDEFYIAAAKVDLEDIDRADAVVFFSENPLVGIKRGGRHVEFGYAVGKNKQIFVIGPRENIFHYLPGVEHWGSLESFARAQGEVNHAGTN
jgi:nucleoside 2-deoxyribosyltransferase